MKFYSFLALLCFSLLATSAFAQKGKAKEEDIVEGEEAADVKVEDDGPDGMPKKDAMSADKDLEEEEELKQVGPSPDAETYILFTDPIGTKDLAAGSLVKFLVGFFNKGDKDFVVDSLEASFRYPMDYSFYIQNYTPAVYDRIVPPNSEATFDYSFIPSEGYAGRPFGLAINLNYKDTNESVFQSAVFNETINIIEDESGFNPETGFLYIVFACVVILLLLLGQQFLSKMRRKHGMAKRPAPVEMGTSNASGVDYDWIPKELLQQNQNNKSPKSGSPRKSPKAGSPRQRAARRQAGAGSDD